MIRLLLFEVLFRNLVIYKCASQNRRFCELEYLELHFILGCQQQSLTQPAGRLCLQAVCGRHLIPVACACMGRLGRYL